MPLLHHKSLPQLGELGLWHITEEESFFLDRLSLYPAEQAELDQIRGHRRIEWLAGRYLLHHLSGRKRRGAFIKDQYGKPHLEGSFFDISISHSRKIAAVIAAPYLVGIDIQKRVPKIERIAHKYMRPEESASLQEDTRIDHLHVYWGAKECLFKGYGRKEVDFKQHLHVTPFQYQGNGGKTEGIVFKEITLHFSLFYEMHDEYMLVYALEDQDTRIAL